jgi:hypothetical protein
VKKSGIFVIFDEMGGGVMKLSLGVILDELAVYKPVAHKTSNAGTEFRQFHYYNREITETSPDCLYVLSGQESCTDFDKNIPRHVIAAGAIPGGLMEKIEVLDTLILIPSISTDVLLQVGYAIFASYETWRSTLLMAVIQHKPIDAFLEMAAEKLANPVVLSGNSTAVISKAGKFLSVKGTIWEKINEPAFVPTDFYTNRERRKLSKYTSQKGEYPYVYHPSADPNHTYVMSLIWINGKLYGRISMIDINAPLTDGQLFIIREITQIFKLYFQNNDIYMQIMANKLNYLDALLEGSEISAELVSRYLIRSKWKLDDAFCFLTFTCPVELTIPIESVSYVRQLNEIFPQALVSVYQNFIIMITRCAEYNLRSGKERQWLEKLLKKNEMRCGVSMVFTDFMRLRCYYVQSSFAVSYCESFPNTRICFYENCQRDHVLRSLASVTDLRTFCHPAILTLWESGEESKQELVRCLYLYLLNGGNIAATAKALFVHRTTLIYRLEKLSGILDTDLKSLDPERSFFYLLSCIIERGR